MSETDTRTLAGMAAEVDEYCQAKGWRENQVTFREAMALLHEEIAEAGSAWRKWGLADNTAVLTYTDQATGQYALAKPEGVGSEFADIFIRLLDDSVLFGVDLDAEVARNPGRFLLSDRFLENMDHMHAIVVRASDTWSLGDGDYREWFSGLLVFLRQLCEFYGIDLQAEYARKMAYNKTRPYKHGNKRQ
jgi:hypothetical protein